MCEDCKFSFEAKGTNCGHHFRTFNDELIKDLPSDGALNRWGRCSYYKRYYTNMDIMKKKLLNTTTAEEFSKMIIEFATILKIFRTDKNRIDWLEKENE